VKKITSEEAAKELLFRRRAREHFAPFVKRGFETVDPGANYTHGWHIDCLAEHCEALFNREIKNLIINLPPRSLKSIVISVCFPAWAFGRDPSERVLSSSGVASLATQHSMHCRKIMREYWYRMTFPETVLDVKEQDAKNRYNTTKGGHRIALSVGGSSVGEGGRIKIIDDPIDPTVATSKSELENVNSWYDNTWSTRSDDPIRTVNLLVMQRIGVNDLTAHLLDKGWDLLKLEQEAESRAVITFPISGKVKIREVGDLLHPERSTPEAIEQYKRDLGTEGYTTQHQQRPNVKGGNRIKMSWFKRYGAIPSRPDEVIQSWDTANKANTLNNPSVCQTYKRFGDVWFLTRLLKERLVYPDLKRNILNLAAVDKPNTILIEDKASGTQIIQELGGKLPIIGIEPEGDKVMRMETQLASIESGVIALPDPEKIVTEWLFDLELVLLTFPKCAEFDSIDSMSQFLKYIRSREDYYFQSGISLGGLSKESYFKGK